MALFRMSAIAAAVMTLTVAEASAQSATGTWLRETGASRVRISPCGDALCGSIVWIKEGADTNAKVGQRIFYEMKPDGAGKWSGKAFNPEDGKTYSGTMSVSGSTLTTSGCVLGGMICRTVSWSKVN